MSERARARARAQARAWTQDRALTWGRDLANYNPWNSPGPKRDFTLSLGFALQRANSRMLRNADKRRRLARSSGKYSSGTRPTSSDEDY